MTRKTRTRQNRANVTVELNVLSRCAAGMRCSYACDAENKSQPNARFHFVRLSHSIARHHIENEFHFRDKPEHTSVLITARLDGPTTQLRPPRPRRSIRLIRTSPAATFIRLPAGKEDDLCLSAGASPAELELRNSFGELSHPPACSSPWSTADHLVGVSVVVLATAGPPSFNWCSRIGSPFP